MKKIFGLLAAVCLILLIVVPSAAPDAGLSQDAAFVSSPDPSLLSVDPLAPTGPANLQCRGAFVGGVYHDVVVPSTPPNDCYLNGTTVTGNVTVQQTGGLRTDSVNIHGNLQANYARYIAVGFPNSIVGGNIQIQHTTSVPTMYGAVANYICRTQLGNDLQIGQSAAAAKFNIGGIGGPPQAPVGFASCSFANTVGGNIQTMNNAGELWISDNTVSGNLQAGSNTGGLHIYANMIGGELQCDSNTEVDGAGNVASSYEGQCTAGTFIYP
jgi:hypothetical protein